MISDKENETINTISNQILHFVCAKVDSFPLSPDRKLLVIAKVVTGLASSLVLSVAKNSKEEEEIVLSVLNDLKKNIAANKGVLPSNNTIN